MRIVVGIKPVPDTETKIKVGPDGFAIDPAAVTKWIISPYDEFALEQALQLKERGVASEVVAVSAGRDSAQQVARQALATGADRAVWIQDPRFDLADGLTRAKALAAVVREEGAGLVLVGKYGVGTDEGQTGAMLAELLAWPNTFAVSKLELVDGRFTAEHEVEGAVEVVDGSLPAVISCEKGLNDPRYPSLKGIMQAKKKPLDLRTAEQCGVGDAELEGEKKLAWEALELPPERASGRLIDGDAEQAARELARLLHQEAKVI
ncbi:MAG TPA: electron transfer flavoprotein subunit beta/FixA family protein [Candidatus Polarisedimenticolaceae bacterium]|nr:electron transfer flavoprotein subunit beta/FixA family protein [Candidatus Polarisedimenticolaceae bacterium]